VTTFWPTLCMYKIHVCIFLFTFFRVLLNTFILVHTLAYGSRKVVEVFHTWLLSVDV